MAVVRPTETTDLGALLVLAGCIVCSVRRNLTVGLLGAADICTA